MLKITGYPDRYSVAPGETIRFMVSLDDGDAFDARLVRVIHGDCNPAGPGLKFAAIEHEANGRYSGGRQPIDAGSYMMARGVPAAGDSFTFTAWLWPTLPDRPMQVVAAQWDAERNAGFKIAVDHGALTLVTGDGAGGIGRHALACRMLKRAWYRIRVKVDGKARRFEIEQQPLAAHALTHDGGSLAGALDMKPGKARGFFLAGCPQPTARWPSTSTARSTARSSPGAAARSSPAGISPGKCSPPGPSMPARTSATASSSTCRRGR